MQKMLDKSYGDPGKSWKKASVDCPYIRPASGYCAGKINTKASHLKLHRFHNRYDDIVIAVAWQVSSNGRLFQS